MSLIVVADCPDCDATGQVPYPEPYVGSMDCPACKGTRRRAVRARKCAACRGSGFTNRLDPRVRQPCVWCGQTGLQPVGFTGDLQAFPGRG